MEAHKGDHLVVEGTKVGSGRRSCEVMRVDESNGHRRFWVRWEDGHESLFVPGPGVRVEAHQPKPRH